MTEFMIAITTSLLGPLVIVRVWTAFKSLVGF